MKNIIIVVILLMIVIVSYIFITNYYINYNKIEIIFIECIDGDTAWFNVNDKKEKVRFLGIDTPESVHPNGIIEDYGKEASEYTCKLLKNANNIYIEYDINSDRYDKYGRLLGWIFVDNNNLSELLLSKGYAEVNYIYDNYKYINNLCMAQKDAYEDRLGIWNNNLNKYKDNHCFKNNY